MPIPLPLCHNLGAVLRIVQNSCVREASAGPFGTGKRCRGVRELPGRLSGAENEVCAAREALHGAGAGGGRGSKTKYRPCRLRPWRTALLNTDAEERGAAVTTHAIPPAPPTTRPHHFLSCAHGISLVRTAMSHVFPAVPRTGGFDGQCCARRPKMAA